MFLSLVINLLDSLILFGFKSFAELLTERTASFYFFQIDSLMSWCLLFFFLISFKVLFEFIRLEKKGKIIQKYLQNLHENFFSAFQMNPGKLQKSNFKTKVQNHFQHEFHYLEKGADGFFQFLQALIQIVVFLPILFYLNWQLSIVVFFILAPLIALVQKFALQLDNPIRNLLQKQDFFFRRLKNYLIIHEKWTISNHLKLADNWFSKNIIAVFNSRLEVIHRTNLIVVLGELISNFGTLLMFLVAGYWVIKGEMDSVDLLVYCGGLIFLYKPVKELSRSTALIKEAQNVWENYQSHYKDVQEMLPCERDISESNLIIVNNVTFGYEESKSVLQNFSTTIDKGEVLWISGENGKGKTTLLKLLAGKLQPLAGDVKLPVDSHIAYLDQEPIIPVLPWENVERLIREPGVSEFVELLGIEKLFTKQSWQRIGDSLGDGLSGGQKQKMALLLTLTSPENIILLDEPTSFLPHAKRQDVIQKIISYCKSKEKTLVLVSHENLNQIETVSKLEMK